MRRDLRHPRGSRAASRVTWVPIVFSVAMMVCPISLPADTIHLKSGKVVIGEIVSETDDAVNVERRFGSSGTIKSPYPRSQIDRIERGPVEYPEQAPQVPDSSTSAPESDFLKDMNGRIKEIQNEIKEAQEESDQRRKRDQAKRDQERAAWERELKRERDSLEFGKSTEYRKRNYWYYQGIINNNGKKRKEFVKITIEFYDSRKQLLRIKSTYTDPVNIPPGGNASYTVMIEASVPVATYITSMGFKIGD